MRLEAETGQDRELFEHVRKLLASDAASGAHGLDRPALAIELEDGDEEGGLALLEESLPRLTGDGAREHSERRALRVRERYGLP